MTFQAFARPRVLSSRTVVTALGMAAMISACSVQAAEPRHETPSNTIESAAMSSDPAMNPTAFALDLSNPEAAAQFGAVNDGVMGGRSSGGPVMGNDHLIFRGVINTNGGGFSSIRMRMTPGALSSADGMTLKLRGDGRTYKLTFRTSQRRGWRPVSWQADIPATEPGEWAEVLVPFNALKPSIFGRRVQADPFDKSDVREMGIIIADGVDGPFRLDVKSIAAQ